MLKDHFQIQDVINKNLDVIKKVRLELNSLAELSFEELKTQKYIKDFLYELNIDVFETAKTGVIGILNPSDECVGIRADMDAILIDNQPKHSCGHDYHMAILLGVAKTLCEIGYKRCVKFIFQPAEEGPGGAKRIIEEGGLKNPNVKKLIGFHLWPELEVGKIEVSSGAIMASVDDFEVDFIGQGGHAAMPEFTKNPIYPAIDFITSANNFFSSYVKKITPFHISFSSINSGSTYNVISDVCKIRGTVRTFDENTQTMINKSLVKLANASCQKYDVKLDFKYYYQYPPLLNNETITKEFIDIMMAIFGKDNIIKAEPSFTAEDFAFYCKQVPSLYFRLGIKKGHKGRHPLHSAQFDASDDCIFYGIYAIVSYLLGIDKFE